MKKTFLVLIFALILIASGCQTKPICPQNPNTELPKYITTKDLQTQSAPTHSPAASPVEIKLNGKPVLVDKIVQGPLCNDTWQGTIYVGCNVQVLRWEEEPLFLKDCDLSIAEGTVVYVADHNNAAYFNGCSCHTGELAEHK